MKATDVTGVPTPDMRCRLSRTKAAHFVLLQEAIPGTYPARTVDNPTGSRRRTGTTATSVIHAPTAPKEDMTNGKLPMVKIFGHSLREPGSGAGALLRYRNSAIVSREPFADGSSACWWRQAAVPRFARFTFLCRFSENFRIPENLLLQSPASLRHNACLFRARQPTP